MWDSVTGSIVLIGQPYSGQLRPGHRAATVDEVAAWQAAQPLQPVTFRNSWPCSRRPSRPRLSARPILTEAVYADGVGRGRSPSDQPGSRRRRQLSRPIRPHRLGARAEALALHPPARSMSRSLLLQSQAVSISAMLAAVETPTRRRWRASVSVAGALAASEQGDVASLSARFPSRALSLQAGWSTPHRQP